MLGVVLWSDNNENKAVIWCEDHGDLAFFNGGDTAPEGLADLDAGDLVHFDLQQEKHQRYAHNPKRIERGAYEGIAEQLQETASPSCHDRMTPSRVRADVSADVIPFARKQAERADRGLFVV